MTQPPSHESTPDERWFSEIGYGLGFSPDCNEEGESFVWANLTRDGSVVAPRYGRGLDEAAAVSSARRRYEVEQ